MPDGIKMYILDLGVMECHRNLLSPGKYSEEEEWGQIPIDAILIDHPTAGKIVFDLGCHPDAMRGHWPRKRREFSPVYHTAEQTMEHQLALCGVKPEEVKTVVISHLHGDHTGYLYLFPHANVVIQKQEYLDGLAYAFLTNSQEERFSILRNDINVPVEQYTLVEGDMELFEGVKLLHLPGHTAGEMGIQLELDHTGTVLLPRDAIHDAYNFGPPVVPPGKCIGFDIYAASMEKIRSIAAETGGMIIFGHDMEQFKSLKHAPEYYD